MTEKFFITNPYPYISGSLHIGHARVVIESDVVARFNKLLGKNVLYPLSFHISGTPVLGISLAIKNGDKKKIELYSGYVRTYIKDENKVKEIIKSFEEPQNIVDFFIPKMKEEFSTLNLLVNWNRSFTSGDLIHQALVEWQFTKYKELGYLVQGNYPILFSTSLQNAVGEDDIKDGDLFPVERQDFTAIKFKFEEGFILAATLRPETMYGQTNLWVNPSSDYVKCEVNNEIWFVSKECSEKLSYQNWNVKIIEEVKGRYFINKEAFAPFVEKLIPILSSSHCDPDKGTGFVTSVPSDAPFDYIALKEIKSKLELIPIIQSKNYKEFPGKEECEKLGIVSLDQKELLDKATKEVYKAGFHTGTLIIGKFKGKSVKEAKELMRDELLKKDEAITFYEVSRSAESRDGGKVIIAVIDGQWFLDFNAKGWKEKAFECLKGIELIPEKYRKQFEDVFDWLDKRPCARKRGLGTKLPFDKNWIIESLSDSTLYMSLYPISHKIKKYKKEQLNYFFFEFVYLNNLSVKEASEKTKISEEELLELQKEWDYWYPFDHRHTFTAHLSNHLSFMIFAHAGLLPKKKWPNKISFHGMVLSNGEKMSKSKGNTVTLLEVNKKFGSDAFRAFICNSTNVESSFNWEASKVEIMKKHITQIEEIIKKIQSGSGETNNKSFISKNEKMIKKATIAIKKMELREYSSIIYDMFNLFKSVEGDVKAYNHIKSSWPTLLMPLIPTTVSKYASETWPIFNESLINEEAEFEELFVEQVKKDIKTVKNLVKLNNPKVILIVSPKWKFELFKFVKKNQDIKTIMKNDQFKKYGQEIMKFLPKLIASRKVPEIVLSQKRELELLKEFNVIIAEECNDKKAKQSMPGKPAILLN